MVVSLIQPILEAGNRQPPPPDSRPLAGRRIGFATSVVGFGGSEVLVADAIEAATEAGAEVVCYCHRQAAIRAIVQERPAVLAQVVFRNWPPNSPSAATSPPAATARGTPATRWSIQGAYRRLVPLPLKRYAGFLTDVRRFCSELKKTSLDAVFVNVNGSEAAAVAAGLWNKARAVTCYHLSYTDPVGTWFDHWVDHVTRKQSLLAAGTIIHTSRAARDQWCGHYGIPTDRTSIIYNGVSEPPACDGLAQRKTLEIAPDDFVFCVPGRLERVKGHVHLLDAVAQARDQLANSVVLICGDGPLRDELEKRSRELQLGSWVRFLGFRRDLPAILAASDCAVLPSVESENLSVAILESLIAGTPAIVTSVGGMAEAVIHETSGLVVPPADAPALAAALAAMATDRDRARRMGQAARQDARQRFSRRRMMNEYVELFSNVIAASAHA